VALYNPSFKLATKEHLKEIYAIEKTSFDANIIIRKKDIKLALNDNEIFILTVKSPIFIQSNPEIVIGYCWIIRKRRYTYIQSVAISEAHRGKGYGRIIVENVLDFINTMKYKYARLHVREDNIAARKLYESLGFANLKLLKHYYDHNKHGFLMEKEINVRIP